MVEAPKLGVYIGSARDVTCPGDHALWPHFFVLFIGHFVQDMAFSKLHGEACACERQGMSGLRSRTSLSFTTPIGPCSEDEGK